MERALEAVREDSVQDRAISFKIQNEIQSLLPKYQTAYMEYNSYYQMQSKGSQKYNKFAKACRLYVSHFIQVLNLAVIRKEIKREHKTLYGLDPNTQIVPDLASDAALIEWGEKIIAGEAKRKQNGGAPIYNPTIARVQVNYDIFSEAYHNQKILQQNSSKSLAVISAMRDSVDPILLEAWNQIEEHYTELPTQERLNSCQRYGMIFYYRKEEKARINAAKLQSKIEFND